MSDPIALLVHDHRRMEKMLETLFQASEQDRAPLVSWRIDMQERVHSNIDQSGLSKQPRKLTTDKRIDAIAPRICNEHPDDCVPRVRGRITHVAEPVGLVEGNPTAWTDETHGFRDDLFRFGHVDQDESRRHEVERRAVEPASPGVAAMDSHVAEVALLQHLAREVHSLLASFDTDDRPGGADAFTEQIETALGAASQLHDVPSRPDSDLVKQLRRFVCELTCLEDQAFLFDTPVTEHVLFSFRHLRPRRARPSFVFSAEPLLFFALPPLYTPWNPIARSEPKGGVVFNLSAAAPAGP